MALQQSRIEEAARILAERRLAGEQGARLPLGCRPETLDDAFKVQTEVARLLGGRIAGWKCALPSEDRLVAAPIFVGTIHAGPGPCPVFASEGRVRVEPELAFVLGQDLPPRVAPYTQLEVDAAIASRRVALELLQNRYWPDEAAEASFAEKLADGLVNQGVFLGPEVDAAQALAATDLAIDVRLASGEEASLVGRHPDGAPQAPIYWLVDFLRRQGQGLSAGQVLITGSYAGSFPLPLGPGITVQFGALGALTVSFAHHPRGHAR